MNIKDKIKKIKETRLEYETQKKREEILSELTKIKDVDGTEYFNMNYIKKMLSIK